MRRVGFADVAHALADSVKITAMLMMLVIGAQIFARFLSISRVPRELLALAEPLLNTPGIIVALMILLFFAGMILESVAIILHHRAGDFPAADLLGAAAHLSRGHVPAARDRRRRTAAFWRALVSAVRAPGRAGDLPAPALVCDVVRLGRLCHGAHVQIGSGSGRCSSWCRSPSG